MKTITALVLALAFIVPAVSFASEVPAPESESAECETEAVVEEGRSGSSGAFSVFARLGFDLSKKEVRDWAREVLKHPEQRKALLAVWRYQTFGY